MITPRLLAFSLILIAPLTLTGYAAHAQDAAPAVAAPAPSTSGSGGDRTGGPPHDGDRAMDRDRRPSRDWGRDSDRDGMLPFGMWWRNPDVVARVGLTAEQQKRIEDTFLQSRVQLIHLHATLQEKQLYLGPLLDATPFDQAKALAQIDSIADTRAELEKTNARMLINIRGVLTPDQWTKLRSRPRGMREPVDRGDRGSQGQPASN